jgi:hypothetical protein
MGPFGFVNWRVVNSHFCLLIWTVAAALAVVILLHVVPAAGGSVQHWHGGLLSTRATAGR